MAEADERNDALTETIVAAAIMYGTQVVSMPAPNRHHHILHKVFNDAGGKYIRADVQGFLTNAGRFVDRTEALMIATKANQVKGSIIGAELYSENLW